MENLSLLEKLYFSEEINRDIFIKYYIWNDDDNKIHKIIIDNNIVSREIINKCLNESFILNIKLENINYNKLEDLYTVGFISLELIENNIYLLKINDIEITEYNLQYNKIVIFEIEKEIVKENYLKKKNKMQSKRNEFKNKTVPETVNKIIKLALDNNGTDIHIESKYKELVIKYRINGELNKKYYLNNNLTDEIVSRLKIMSNLDIAIKNDIQNGEFIYNYKGENINIRISIIPNIYGEKISLRILDNENTIIELGNLEFKDDLYKLNRLLNNKSGLILIVGPTGCGKSTSLYSILKSFDNEKNNIITVEDPVELKINNINQIQINDKINLNYNKILKSILRHDPEIIMVGEIRERETAIQVARAAITGHLVLSTLHTNNSHEAIERLIDIGVEPFMVAASLKGVISQRLVKVLCPRCKIKYNIKQFEKNLLNIDNDIYLYRHNGCNECLDGFIGRKAIFEILDITDNMKEKIRNYNKSTNLYGDIAMKRLKDRCIDEIINGNIEFDEIYEFGE